MNLGGSTQHMLTIPWVTGIPGNQRKLPCDGFTKRYSHHPQKCKLKARFHYTGSTDPDHYAMTGNYCHPHTVSNLYDEDCFRYQAWLKENTE
jgi:hypothetical protein